MRLARGVLTPRSIPSNRADSRLSLSLCTSCASSISLPVRSSPDLRHANIFCSALGKSGKEEMESIAAALNRAAGFLRGRLGREIDMKFTPQLHFIPDHSYDEAAEMSEVFRRAEVARDLDPEDE